MILGNDCEWSNWVDGKCTKECANATKTSTREKTITEVTGGVCNGTSTKILPCMDRQCPGK